MGTIAYGMEEIEVALGIGFVLDVEANYSSIPAYVGAPCATSDV